MHSGTQARAKPLPHVVVAFYYLYIHRFHCFCERYFVIWCDGVKVDVVSDGGVIVLQ